MRVELLMDMNSSVQTRKNARSLDKNSFLSKEDTLSKEVLSYMLISLADSAPIKIMQERARDAAILIVDEATCRTGTAVMQYIKKCFNPIFNKADTITTTLEEISSTAKTVTKNAKHTVDETNTQKHKDNKTRGRAMGVIYAGALKGKTPLTSK